MTSTENKLRPAQPERVVLAGFMGSGKTTVGQHLSRLLGWAFVDLDTAVSAREGLPVPAIFAQRGEAAFREAEVAVLQQLLQRPHCVIALGGGAPETPAVRALLAADSLALTVHLHAAAEVLFARCVAQAMEEPSATERPLLGSAEMAAARYQRRLPLYAAVAHHVVEVTDRGPEDLAAAIAGLVHSENVTRLNVL